MPLRTHGFLVGFGFGIGFGVGLTRFIALRAVLVRLALTFVVALTFDLTADLVFALATLAIGLEAVVLALVMVFGAFDWLAAMAVPVIRKAAAVSDASNCFKMCSSFP